MNFIQTDTDRRMATELFDAQFSLLSKHQKFEALILQLLKEFLFFKYTNFMFTFPYFMFEIVVFMQISIYDEKSGRKKLCSNQ